MTGHPPNGAPGPGPEKIQAPPQLDLSGLVRPDRLPHQQGLSEGKVGCRDRCGGAPEPVEGAESAMNAGAESAMSGEDKPEFTASDTVTQTQAGGRACKEWGVEGGGGAHRG